MTGDSISQRQEGFQEPPFGLSKEGHAGACFPATEDGAQGDNQNVMQGMTPGGSRTGDPPAVPTPQPASPSPQPPHTRMPHRLIPSIIYYLLLKRPLTHSTSNAIALDGGLLGRRERTKPKPRWDVHFHGVVVRAGSFAGTPLPLIAGRSGTAA